MFGQGVVDLFKQWVIEPATVKEQIIRSAMDCACMILRIDDVIADGSKGSLPSRSPGEDGMPPMPE